MTTEHDKEPHPEEHAAGGKDASFDARKTYYVAVGGAQILEDPEAAAYELVIRANEEELNRLQELFEELVSWDEAQTFHFAKTPFSSFSTDRINLGYDLLLKRVYTMLYELGTESTRAHIESIAFVEIPEEKETTDS